MGMIIKVFRSNSKDATNGGISSKFDRLVVVNVDGPFNPSEDMPAVFLVSHMRGCLRLVPAVLVPEVWTDGQPRYTLVQGTMAGGNFGASSDARFSEACERLAGTTFYGAVAIHDRVE